MSYQTFPRMPLLATLIVGALALPTGAEAAGLLEFLFGGGGFARPSRPSFDYEPPPLQMRVNPKRSKASRAPGGKERRVAKQQPIDPAKNPNWYLEDPTLRRGDIVVLRSGPKVFEGGNVPLSPSDFTALSRSRLVSKADRDRIERMTQRDGRDENPYAAAGETAPREAALKPN